MTVQTQCIIRRIWFKGVNIHGGSRGNSMLGGEVNIFTITPANASFTAGWTSSDCAQDGSCLTLNKSGTYLYPTDTRLQAKLFDCLLGDGEAAGGGAVVWHDWIQPERVWEKSDGIYVLTNASSNTKLIPARHFKIKCSNLMTELARTQDTLYICIFCMK